MQGSSRRRVVTRTGVAAGSVWETRMRIDEVKGGIKVFNGQESRQNDDEKSANGDDLGIKVNRSLRRNQSDSVTTERRKRKSWQPPDVSSISGGSVRSPIQLRKARSDLCNSPKILSCQEIGGDQTVMSSPGNAGVIGEKRVLLIRDGREGVGGNEVELEEEIVMEEEEERKSFDDKEIVLPAEKLENVDEEKRIHPIPEIPMSPVAEKKMDPKPIPPPPVKMMVEDEVDESTSVAQDQMQNIVDLVMWKDISKSAFVFGVGTFSLLSSSYTKDIEFSLLSAISYLGLVYLALIFFYRSILHRGVIDLDERDVVGEEDAIWILRWLLPYINEMLIKLKSLFSGDPAVTMKLAVLLFVLARCGSSITIWTLAKLVFFGVFTIPKIFSSYKVQLARYGKFWVERLSDGWESCTHKKAVAAAVFTLIWNVSSTVARVWAVFMLVVAVRLYQQQRGTEAWSVEELAEEEMVEEESRQEDSKLMGPLRYGQRPVGPMVMILKMAGREVKLKKWT